MQWNRSQTIGLAKVACAFCHGYGLRLVHSGKEAPCQCVFRAVFRACHNRFREFAATGAHTSTVTLEFCRSNEGRRVYSRKREEFMADFCIVSRRSLTDVENRVFSAHFLLGADWKLCCRQLRIDRGTYFHVIYRIEQKLGRAFAELQPYPLYPIDEYLGGTGRAEPEAAIPALSIRIRSRRRMVSLPLSA